MIAFAEKPSQKNRFEKNRSTKKNSELKIVQPKFVRSKFEPKKNRNQIFNQPKFSADVFDEVLQPHPFGRHVLAVRTSKGIEIETRVGDCPIESITKRDSFLQTIKRELGTTIHEVTARGASLLIARLASPLESERCWCIRWTEHRSSGGDQAELYFQTADRSALESVALQIAWKWQERLMTTETISLPFDDRFCCDGCLNGDDCDHP